MKKRLIISKSLCILVIVVYALNCLLGAKLGNKAEAAETDEMRAVWVPTVYSLDYPSGYTEKADILKNDIDEIMQNISNMGFNTVFFQVRPACDALYKSDIFPWSKYLTGTQGKAPLDNFDPLEYAVSSAHKKGLKLHAWINPYRVTATEGDNDSLAENNPAVKYPEIAVKHTDGKLYLNPGEPKSNQLVIDGAKEIVKKYDVDGVHLDDYFYPDSHFEDDATFEKYKGEYTNKDDWRRNNITALIDGLKTAVKAEKPNIMFGVSPVGIWANNSENELGSATGGQQSYYDRYADTRQWAKTNKVDYIMPQIYWNIGYSIADYRVLAKWWSDVVSGSNTKLYIGMAAYKAADSTNESDAWYGEKGIKEIRNQIELNRSLDNVSGYCMYRYKSLIQNDGLKKAVTALNQNALFMDINDYPWAREAIESLGKDKIINGMGDGTFGGSREISRADFTLILTRLMNGKAEFTENFSDVTSDKYYYNEVGIAKKLGFVSGMGDNLFMPENCITRQDIAVMTYRIMIKQNIISENKDMSNLDKFSDNTEISDYAKQAVSALVKNGIINGYESGDIKPKGSATRAETAVIIYRIKNMIK